MHEHRPRLLHPHRLLAPLEDCATLKQPSDGRTGVAHHALTVGNRGLSDRLRQHLPVRLNHCQVDDVATEDGWVGPSIRVRQQFHRDEIRHSRRRQPHDYVRYAWLLKGDASLPDNFELERRTRDEETCADSVLIDAHGTSDHDPLTRDRQRIESALLACFTKSSIRRVCGDDKVDVDRLPVFAEPHRQRRPSREQAVSGPQTLSVHAAERHCDQLVATTCEHRHRARHADLRSRPALTQ